MEATLRFTVTDADTAAAVGSGSLPVLGTPRLLAWCEAATCAALEPTLPAGSTSVGTRVELEHLAASGVGQEVEVTASASYVDGRLHRFTVAARNVGRTRGGRLIGTGEITRVVVDAERFLSRL
ncbi:thioesterase family protein [Nocardioides aquiterrae]|uniref:Fluoroacetyl-CoA-specific thioesterase-like domain-containing protein n=1 Tax=Nocardioides aquiterrae TaxID=203799 RepID=A0ABN1U8I9_9ACTN